LREAERDTQASGSKRTRYHLVMMRAAQLVDTRDWEGPAARLEIDLDELSPPTVAADHCVRGLAALGRGEITSAKEILATMRGASPWDGVIPEPGATLASCCAPPSAVDVIVEGPGRTAAEIMARELEGAIRLAEGEDEAGLALLRAAAELEDGMGFDFGPPIVVLPAHELLGDALLERGDAEAAVAELQAALERAPKRARSLKLLARAAAASGDDVLAARTRAELAAISRSGPSTPVGSSAAARSGG
jgi:predicted Zn-dependent protease